MYKKDSVINNLHLLINHNTKPNQTTTTTTTTANSTAVVTNAADNIDNSA